MEMAMALRSVLRGGAPIDPFIARRIIEELPLQAPPTVHRVDDPSLSARENTILHLVVEGLSNREIAERLCISSKTVSNHMALLKSKLDVSSQAELVHLAIDQGLLRVGERLLCDA